MSRFALATLTLGLLTGGAWAVPEFRPLQRPSQPAWAGQPQWPGEQCRSAIAAAERARAVPPQLLAAIGRVESGKRDPGTGIWGAWPWTINAEGVGAWFESKAEAIQAVLTLRARGVRSVDVGCMQVNLMYHPTAFETLDQAFDPVANADYAARFLVRLHDQSGDWTKATASYHSANPWEGEPYAAKVNAVWPEEQRKAGLAPPPPPPRIAAASTGAMTGRDAVGGRFMPFGRADQRLPARRPPPMFGMALASTAAPPSYPLTGLTPGVPSRVSPGATAPGFLRAAAPLPASGMMLASAADGRGPLPLGTTPPGMARSVLTPGIQTGMDPAQSNPGTGHGLSFYRATPVATGMVARPRSSISFRAPSR